MTAAEFITELEKVAHLFEWSLVAQRERIEDRRARPRLQIRGARPSYGLVFDPIGSVCFARTGKVFNVDSWPGAANAIELVMIDAGDLTAAANDRTWKDNGDRREPDSYLQSLRSRLAIAVGLEMQG